MHKSPFPAVLPVHTCNSPKFNQKIKGNWTGLSKKTTRQQKPAGYLTSLHHLLSKLPSKIGNKYFWTESNINARLKELYQSKMSQNARNKVSEDFKFQLLRGSMPTNPLRRACCFTSKHAFYPSVIQLSCLLSSNQTIFAYLMIILTEPMYNDGTCTYTVIILFYTVLAQWIIFQTCLTSYVGRQGRLTYWTSFFWRMNSKLWTETQIL